MTKLVILDYESGRVIFLEIDNKLLEIENDKEDLSDKIEKVLSERFNLDNIYWMELKNGIFYESIS